MSFQIFTLVSGSYVQAATALINSLQVHGYDGEIIVGHSGDIKWNLSPSAPVKTVNIDDSHSKWISNLKPSFIRKYASGGYAFVDADCIIGSARLFDVISQTISNCPLLCIEALLPSSDHRRRIWRRVADETIGVRAGGAPARSSSRDHYFNGGFISGHSQRDAALLAEWENMIGALRGFGALEEDPRFRMADQDCLNAVLQDLDDPVATICPPDVWYAANPSHPFLHLGSSDGPLLLHCTGRDKPWLRRDIPPRAPNIYERQWAKLASGTDAWAQSEVTIPRAVNAWLNGTLEGRFRQRAEAVFARGRSVFSR
jgi:hypothetical protein